MHSYLYYQETEKKKNIPVQFWALSPSSKSCWCTLGLLDLHEVVSPGVQVWGNNPLFRSWLRPSPFPCGLGTTCGSPPNPGFYQLRAQETQFRVQQETQIPHRLGWSTAVKPATLSSSFPFTFSVLVPLCPEKNRKKLPSFSHSFCF